MSTKKEGIIQNMSKVSIVVPVYNVEKYLQRCVSSILGQTLQDIEIILVDDGSRDSSGKLCDEYAKEDSRIVVVHKENGGLSSARNAGIDVATSPYIGFVDSDDYIDEEMYEKLYNWITENEADIAMCELCHCYEDKEITKRTNTEFGVVNDEQAIRLVMEGNKATVSAVNKLYKTSIFDKVKYPVGKLTEDAFVIVEVLMQARKVVYSTEELYYYVHRKNSITTSRFKKKDLNVLEAYSKNRELIKKNYPALRDVADMRCIWAHFYVLDKMMLSKELEEKDIQKKIIKTLRKNYKFIMKNELFNISRKIAMTLLMINQKLYKVCVLVNKKNYTD